MTKFLEKIHAVSGWALLAVSAWLAVGGLLDYLATIGGVVGSEFGMLIALVNQLGKIAVWLGVFGIRLAARPDSLKGKEYDHAKIL